MSHLDKKLKWCFDKAEKELSLTRKHRGLIKIIPNNHEAKKHILKAEHNFKAGLLLEDSFSDWSISAYFYTIYHCFLAILIKHGYESRNQECTLALIKYLKENKVTDLEWEIIRVIDFENMNLESNVLNLRENFQYGTETSILDKKLETIKELCKRTIEQTKKEIYHQN